LILGAGLRVAYLIAFRRVPLFDHLQLDHRLYDEWGQRIANGDWLGTKVFFVDPLYAYVLGALYALFGHDLLMVRVVHVLLGLAVCCCTALLGRRVFGSAAIGNVACLLAAIFVPAILYESAVDKTVLAELLFSVACLAFLGTSARAALGAGLALGL